MVQCQKPYNSLYDRELHNRRISSNYQHYHQRPRLPQTKNKIVPSFLPNLNCDNECYCNTFLKHRFVNDNIYMPADKQPTVFYKCSRQHIISDCCMTRDGKCKFHKYNGFCVPIRASRVCKYGCYGTPHIHNCVGKDMLLCKDRPSTATVDLTLRTQTVVLCVFTYNVACRLQVHLTDGAIVGYVPLQCDCKSESVTFTLMLNTNNGFAVSKTNINPPINTFVDKRIPIICHNPDNQFLCRYNISLTISLVVVEPPLTAVEKIVADAFVEDEFD